MAALYPTFLYLIIMVVELWNIYSIMCRNPMGRIRAVDLFCGVGGLTRGFLDAGIEVVCGIDILNDVKSIYEKNNKGAFYRRQDISTMNGNDIKALLDDGNNENAKTLLTGCAPCQSFSLKNKKRKQRKDQKQTLTYHFAELVNDIVPDFVFMENVPGIKIYESDMFSYFIAILKDNGYS